MLKIITLALALAVAPSLASAGSVAGEELTWDQLKSLMMTLADQCDQRAKDAEAGVWGLEVTASAWSATALVAKHVRYPRRTR
jgi:hypothetical protein